MNLKNIFSRKAAPMKAVENLLNAILYQWTGDMAYLPPDDIQSYIDDGYKGNIHVYSVVTAISQRCTGIPFEHYVNGEEVKNSEVLKLLSQPNPEQSQGEFIEASVSWLLLTGNLYWYRLAPEIGLNKGKPYELWCLPAHLVRIKGGGVTQPVTGYEIELSIELMPPLLIGIIWSSDMFFSLPHAKHFLPCKSKTMSLISAFDVKIQASLLG